MALDPPYRLDPWQNIVEVGWNAVRYAQVSFDISGEDTMTGRDPGVCPVPEGQDFGDQYHSIDGDGINWVWTYGEPISKAVFKVKRATGDGAHVLDPLHDVESQIAVTMPTPPDPIHREQSDTDQVSNIAMSTPVPGGLADPIYTDLDLSDWTPGSIVGFVWTRFVLDSELRCVGPITEPPGYLARFINDYITGDPGTPPLSMSAGRVHFKDKTFRPVGYKLALGRITLLFRKQD